jgi:Cu-processing system ATP-binding protein
LTELETRTDRIAIMSKGKLVANDALVNLRANANLSIQVKVTTAQDDADRIAAELGGVRMNGRSFSLTCKQEDKIETLAKVAALGGVIKDIDLNLAGLEELYRHYSGVNEGIN